MEKARERWGINGGPKEGRRRVNNDDEEIEKRRIGVAMGITPS